MALIIRHAVSDDAHAITSHNIAMALETENRNLDFETVNNGVLAVLDDHTKGFYIVAEFDNSIVGQLMATSEWSDWRCGYFWWLQSVFVREECRRRGIFSRLFKVLLDEAEKEPEVVGIRLYVEEKNQTAMKAYICQGLVRARYTIFEREF